MRVENYDLLIVGGGASGLAAAITAARVFENSQNTAMKIGLLEAQPRVGKKILATGNGRCNLSNRSLQSGFYFENGSFAMDVMKRADNSVVLDFFHSLGLLTREDGAGRIYPKSNQASSVLDALRFGLEKYNIKILSDTKVESIDRQKDRFLINSQISASLVILATGGQSASKLGSDGSGFSLLRSFGIKIIPPAPALVGLLLEKAYPRSLKGLRADCSVEICLSEGGSKADKNWGFPHKMEILAQDRGEVQFNQNGVSGIPVMQISRFATLNAEKNVFLVLDFLPDMCVAEVSAYIKKRSEVFPFLSASDLLGGLMPRILGLSCIKRTNIPPSIPLKKLHPSQIEAISKAVKQDIYKVEGTQGFDFSQVTAGGADTAEFDANTLESKKVKGLYCCGEIINVDGMCGGYNLQWAWSSGMISGEAAALGLI